MECPVNPSMAFNDKNVEQLALVHLDSSHELCMPLIGWARPCRMTKRS